MHNEGKFVSFKSMTNLNANDKFMWDFIPDVRTRNKENSAISLDDVRKGI